MLLEKYFTMLNVNAMKSCGYYELRRYMFSTYAKPSAQLFPVFNSNIYNLICAFDFQRISSHCCTFGWSRTGTATRTATLMGLSRVKSNILLFSDDASPVEQKWNKIDLLWIYISYCVNKVKTHENFLDKMHMVTMWVYVLSSSGVPWFFCHS